MMAELIYEEIPPSGKAAPKYLEYVPVVEEFERSLRPSARVRDDMDAARIATRLRMAVAHSSARDKVAVRMRGNHVYLVREDMIR